MRARARFVGLLMVIVLLVAVATAGPVTYIVTVDDQGISYYLNSTDGGTLETPVQIGQLATAYQYGAGMGYFTDDVNDGKYYDFVVGSGYTDGPPKEIYLYERKNSGNDFLGPTKIGDWSSGDRPADMPVANFDGKVFDENALADFVMVRYPSQYAGLYLNKGSGSFESSELAIVLPQGAIGADTADIDHDGNADLVVVSVTDPYIYVYLGNGDGTFTAVDPIQTAYGTPCWGITAADFDGDNKVDLIATSAMFDSNQNGFEFYKGDGLGNFEPSVTGRFGSGLISARASVDNYALNEYGYQDLVVSNLADPNAYGVMVGLNDGTGVFTFGTPYSASGSGTGLMAISAPPVFQNEAPVAVVSVSAVSPGVLYDGNKIIAGTTLKFLSSSADLVDQSYDPEGKELEYSWQIEGYPDSIKTTPVAEYPFTEPGKYDVTLTLTDNYGATTEKTVTINVNYPPVAAEDIYSTNMNTPLSVDAVKGVLWNDNDEDLDPLTVILVSNPTWGMLKLEEGKEGGSFTYTPSADFTGTDSFTYKVNDGFEDSIVATVKITVNAPTVQTWDVNIVPSMVNLKSRGVFIAFITLPKPYNAADVQKESVYCEGAYATRLIRHAKFPQVFGAIFRTTDLDGVQVGNKQTFTVTGQVMYEGLPYAFSGDDTVRVFTIKTKVRDETEEFGDLSDKHLFDKYKGNKDNKDKKDNR